MRLGEAMRLLPFEYAVRGLGRSPVRLAASLLGSALVVLILIAAAAFVRGLERSLTVTGEPDNVILLGAGSEESIERSQIDGATASLVEAAIPGIRRRMGLGYVSPEVHMAVSMRLRSDSPELPGVLRGITNAAFLVHPAVRIVEGRAPAPGEDELIVGSLAYTRLGVSPSELAIGRTLWFDERPWEIVGRFSAPRTVMDAEIWLPLRGMQIAAKRDSLSCVVMTLGEAEFADVDIFCKQRLDLELVAIPEPRYYAKLLDFYRPVRAMVWVTAALIAMAGVFGGLNTMYAAFSARVRELGTLQALGFSRTAIVISLVQESVLVTALGALAAAGLGLLVFQGASVRFSMGAFGMMVDAPVMAFALAAGFLLGVVGALPPAWRCLRLPVPVAVRSE